MRKFFLHPARVVPTAFLSLILIGTALLKLPISTPAGVSTRWMDAAFTAVSATCVTGLITLDTASHWSHFGKVVILGLIQVGGYGMVTLATLLTLIVRGRLRLRATLGAATETHSLSLGEVRKVPLRVAVVILSTEAVVAAWLSVRFRIAYDPDWPTAIWHGVFHAISAFCNAGFALYPDSLMGFASDAWIIFAICAAVIAGGLGFPVYAELSRRHRFWHFQSWSVHARLTVVGTLVLLVAGTALFGLYEWNNPQTLGPMSEWGKVIGSIAGGVFPRTAGFNAIDYGSVAPETLAVNYVLMFIGGGSAGTAGGIKVATFFLLAFVIWSEIRGEGETQIANRRISPAVQRQALTVALLGVGLVALGTMIVLADTPYSLDIVLFEVISAFGTVGLSTGITHELPELAKWTLMVLMFIGRVGTITAVTALTVNRRRHRYRLPEESPIVG